MYYRDGEFGGEPMVFQAKDEIYVGSYVYNEEENQSYFLLYDGDTNNLVCRLKMPERVPFGFHGQFIPGQELEDHVLHHEALEAGFNSHCPMKWIRFFIKDYILG